MAIKCGETITISLMTRCPTVYSIEVKLYDPNGNLIATLSNPAYSITQLDNEKYKLTILYTLPSDCTAGMWAADITVQPSADTYQKETIKFYVAEA